MDEYIKVNKTKLESIKNKLIETPTENMTEYGHGCRDSKISMITAILSESTIVEDGWVKIESEADLPTEDCRYWLANENGMFDFFGSIYTVQKKFENETLTHYKKLQESPPPNK